MTNNILNIIENARNWIRTLAVSVSSFRSHFSQIAALAAFLLFIGAGNVWGYIYIDIPTSYDGRWVSSKNEVFTTTDEFENPYGIDQISYKYNSISGGEGIIVEYYNGSKWKSWNEKSAANNGVVVDAIPANNEARNAVRFRFKSKGKNGWHAIWDLKIRIAPMAAKNSGNDLKNNRTWSGPHATFTLSGDNGNNGTLEAINVNANTNVTINWSVDHGCTINVTQLSLWIGHNGWFSRDCDIYVNGSKAGTVGTIINEERDYSGYNLGNNGSFVFYPSRDINLYGVQITYTITPNAPSAAAGKSVTVTINEESINLIELHNNVFSIPADNPEDFTYTYEVVNNLDYGHIYDNHYFWADSAGDYTIRAHVNAAEDGDHEASAVTETTVQVQHIGNTLRVTSTAYSPYVEEEISEVVLDKNSDAELIISSSYGTIAYYDEDDNKIYVPNSEGVSFGEDGEFEVLISISQKATKWYAEVNKIITLTVSKYDNSITATVPSSTMRLFSTLEDGVTLEATNTDYVGSPIGCEQIRGTGDTLTYDYDEDERTVDFESHQFLGTGTWRFTQPENYKYKAATATVSIKVVNDTCTFYGDDSKSWDLESNWKGGEKPADDYASVIIDGELEIASEKQVYSMSFNERSKAIVSIAPTGGLTVGAGGISGASKDKLILRAGKDGDTKGQTGFLRISPYFDGDMPEASVEMYATAFYDVNGESGSKAVYQCTGAPIDTTEILASNVFTKGSYLYTWNESTSEWTSNRTSLYFTTPFRGFEITQKKIREGWTFTYAGHIVSGHDIKEINLSYTEGKGYNLLANSFTAPIDITSFDSEDFVNAHKTIYILNAGTMNESISPKKAIDAPGKWIGVPVETAEYLAGQGLPRVIAPMQGFWIKANDDDPSKTPQLKLDYSRLVWGVDFSGLKSNTPLRVTKRETEQTEVEKMTISVSSESEKDILFLLESEQFDNAYEDGYDAFKVSSGSLDIYSLEGEDKLGVDATNSIIGTSVGVRTGEETAYTLEFSYVSGEDWALVDMEADEVINIREGTQYTFFAEPNAEINDRFMIVEGENVPAITTGVDNVENGAKVHKFIKDNQLFILKDGVLYNAFGAVVR